MDSTKFIVMSVERSFQAFWRLSQSSSLLLGFVSWMVLNRISHKCSMGFMCGFGQVSPKFAHPYPQAITSPAWIYGKEHCRVERNTHFPCQKAFWLKAACVAVAPGYTGADSWSNNTTIQLTKTIPWHAAKYHYRPWPMIYCWNNTIWAEFFTLSSHNCPFCSTEHLEWDLITK